MELFMLSFDQNVSFVNDIFILFFVFLFFWISMQNEEEDMQRRSKFSFTAIDMLKVDPVSKLLFLQEPIIERRFWSNDNINNSI